MSFPNLYLFHCGTRNNAEGDKINFAFAVKLSGNLFLTIPSKDSGRGVGWGDEHEEKGENSAQRT